MKKRIVLALLIVSAQKLWAETLTQEDVQVQQLAKARLYPGGADQEPLQVQAQLPTVTRKMRPAQEPLEIPDESPEPANND